MRRRRAMSEINVVPYIDVMLVLLIIFMVAAPLINPGQIDLPQVGAKLDPAVAPLEVRVRQNGELAVVDRSRSTDEIAVKRGQLLEIVRRAAGAAPGQVGVVVDPHGHAHHLVTLGDQEGRGSRRVDAARHGHEHPHAPTPLPPGWGSRARTWSR